MPSAGGGIREPVECIVKVDGREVTEFYPALREARVESGRRGAAVCTLTFESVRLENGRWTVQDAGVFLPWRRLTVEAAFGSRREEVMRGYIREVKVDYPADMSAAAVKVVAQDESLALDREHVRRTWSTAENPLTDGQVAERIARDHGFQASCSTGLRNAALSSDGTPVKLLQERAEANGYEFYLRAGTLHFGPPQLGGSPQPAILVYAGESTNALGFAVSNDGHKPDAVSLTRAAEKGDRAESETLKPGMRLLGREAADSARLGLKPFTWAMQQSGGATLDEARARAQAKADEAAWKLVAEGELDGAIYGHVLVPFRTVVVDGVGDTYGGTWYVDEVKHVFSAEGYRQSFRLLRNALGDDMSGAAPDPLALVRL